MNYEVYSKIEVSDDFNIFDFISTGKNGDILKRVVFSKTEEVGVYNLALGDVEEDNEMNDHVITDNGDRNKVLATVAAIVEAYTKRFPFRWIIFRGNTEERTRLYRMALGLHLDELSSLYEIWAYKDEQLVPFTKNLKTTAFLIKRKIS
ncbi:MAG TPA: hypothetical protein VHD83_26575 [Puia sp.]|nr:hypothetical protein [Puia sp.]